MKYVAVGFKVDKDKSIFYTKDDDLIRFLDRLYRNIKAHEPDFVSLRMVRDK